MLLSEIYHKEPIKKIKPSETALYQQQSFLEANKSFYLLLGNQFYKIKNRAEKSKCHLFTCASIKCEDLMLINKNEKKKNFSCMSLFQLLKVENKQLILELRLSSDYYELYEETNN